MWVMQSCDVFHTQHAIFFATLDTCASTMWFGPSQGLHVLMYTHWTVLTCFCNIKLVIFVVCVCVCVFFLGSMCLIFWMRDDFESSKCCLDPWLCCMLDCIHVCVFHFSKNCFYKLARHLLDTLLYIEFLKLFHITISIACRHLVDRSRKLLPPR